MNNYRVTEQEGVYYPEYGEHRGRMVETRDRIFYDKWISWKRFEDEPQFLCKYKAIEFCTDHQWDNRCAAVEIPTVVWESDD